MFDHVDTPNAFPGVIAALHGQAAAILGAVTLGNISTAKAMFNQIPEKRKAYVTMLLIDDLADNEGIRNSMRRFIGSVTE